MIRLLTLSVLGFVLIGNIAPASEITGKYVEARTCDVWTGPCFANADFNLTGKHGVMAWKVERGTVGDVSLDGLGVVAVISARDTLGLKQTGPAKVVFIVDSQATPAQQQALVKMAQDQAGNLLKNIVSVQTGNIDLTVCDCKGGSCAEVQAGKAKIKTRCLHAKHDRVCGNESAYYPPLAKNVRVTPAAAEEHIYSGSGLGGTWQDFDRRGAYVGTFRIQ